MELTLSLSWHFSRLYATCIHKLNAQSEQLKLREISNQITSWHCINIIGRNCPIQVTNHSYDISIGDMVDGFGLKVYNYNDEKPYVN
jgi:DNA polymerase II small subunit/DNA polymerase delta subunit B